MKKIIALLTLTLILVTSMPLFANESFDITNVNKGVIVVKHKDDLSASYRVLVKKGDKQLTYPYSPDGKPITFPLQLGNGDYTIAVLKNISGSKFAVVTSVNAKVELKDQNIVFVQSIQNVNWSDTDKAILFGKDLLKGKDDKSSVEAIYDYMVKNVVYDWDKISKLTLDYVPSIAKTFVDNKGICYDYSSMIAAILRSNGYPTKLVKGYTTYVDGYHAWNEVYIGGKWYIIDATVDAGTTQQTMFKEASKYTKVNDY